MIDPYYYYRALLKGFYRCESTYGATLHRFCNYETDSFIMCLLFKQLMHNLLLFTAYLVFSIIWQLFKCTAFIYSMWIFTDFTHSLNTYIRMWIFLSLDCRCLFDLGLVDTLSREFHRCSKKVYIWCKVNSLLEIWSTHFFFALLSSFWNRV